MRLDVALPLAVLLCVTSVSNASKDEAPPGYQTLFGGVVGQELANVTTDDEDIAAAIKVSLEHVYGKNAQHHHVKDVEKHRLLFSHNGTHPYLFKQRSTSKNGQLLVQNVQLVIGLLYHVSIFHQGGDHLCEECRLLQHELTLTRDRNKDFHIFRHTTRHGAPMSVNLHMPEVHLKNCTCSLLSPESHDGTNLKLFVSTHRDARVWTDESHYSHSGHMNLYSPLQVNEGEHCVISSSEDGACQSRSATKSHHLYRPLRIATYNVWNVNSLTTMKESYEDRITRLGKFISSLNVDIIGFQEVRLEVFHRPPLGKKHRKKAPVTQPQISQLAEHLSGFQYIYQPAMLYTDRLPERSEEGVAIFSRYPILSSDYILLYRNKSDEADGHQRVCLHVEVLTPVFGKVHVFVTHLSLSKDAQEKSVIEIWKYMERFSGLKFLMGDLNAEPQSPTIRSLSGELALHGREITGLSDTWLAIEANKNKTGFTFNALDDELVKRIDYIFMGQSNPPLAQVVQTDVMNSGKYCNMPCSDHLPLVTQILPLINRTQV